jgi:hypothetical protein
LNLPVAEHYSNAENSQVRLLFWFEIDKSVDMLRRSRREAPDARTIPKNATSSLADLYDPDTMPAELRKAHRELDVAVDKLYRARPFGSDRERVEHLFPLYEALVQPTSAAPKANQRTARRTARRTQL